MNKKLLIGFCLFLILCSAVATADISRDYALEKIADSEAIRDELQLLNFSVHAFNDSINEAYYALERADFAELIRSGAQGELADQAREVLKGLDYKGFTYSDVLEYTNAVADRKDWAYDLSDRMNILEQKIEEYEAQGVPVLVAKAGLAKAKSTFKLERYSETEEALTEASGFIDESKAQLTAINTIIRSGRSYFVNHWVEFIIVLILLGILGLIFWYEYRKRFLKKKLIRLELERKALIKLQKQIQVERFQKATLSQNIYLRKKEQYDKRLVQVEEMIPAIKKQLKGDFLEKKKKSKKNS